MGPVSIPRLPAVAGSLVLILVVAACGTPAGSEAQPDGVDVVTTTSVFADMVRQVGGDRVRVASLVPKGGEVHTFDPTPSDVRRVTEADVVFRNGLELDNWLANLVVDAGTNAPVIALGDEIEGVTLLNDKTREGQAEPEPNPHLWMNVAYASLYAERIAGALAEADPDGAAAYAAGLAAYRRVLDELDADIKAAIGAVPEANRTVVGFHDAFPYFAAAYGLTIDGTIVNAPGQDPSAGEIADLIAAIRTNNVRAIFAEAQFNDDLAQAIANETGASVVSDLYTDSVGDPPQDTYESMMRWNIERIVAALKA